MLIEIWTDGACSGNPGPGGWGAILRCEGYPDKVLSGNVADTTNQRMELTAVIEGLKAVKKPELTTKLYSDSSYVVNCYNEKWYEKWIRANWRNASKKPVANKDLWLEFIAQISRYPALQLIKVSGHAGVEMNEKVNIVAQEAIRK